MESRNHIYYICQTNRNNMDNLKIESSNVTLVDLVEEKLLNYFKEMKIMPGDPIPKETDLASALGVGRSVLREALSRFRMLGLVTSRTRRGMVLSEPDMLGGLNKVIDPAIMSIDNLKQILGLRIALEIGNTYLIIKNIKNTDIEELELIIEGHQATEYNKFIVDIDHAFHSKLHQIAGNNLISKYQDIFYKVFVFVDENFKKYFEKYNKTTPKSELVSHRDLIEELKNRDVSGFQTLMQKHLALYIDFIES